MTIASEDRGDAFIAAAHAIVGSAGIVDGDDRAAVAENCCGAVRTVVTVVRPQSTEELKAVLHAARQHRVPIYTVSTGKNWGYGTSLPVQDGCAIVDLSRMRSILRFDEELGIVTVEPGVTQQQLHDFLAERQLPFMVPVTGAGPDCSILGNALERGYGITPHADHFGAVRAIEALLADGSVYRSSLGAIDCEAVDRVFKWGTGPYLDGLFTQSNMGIVTSMTIALARRPEIIEGFLIRLPRSEDLERTVTAVRELLRTIGGVTGSINILNDRRVLSMFAPYPEKTWEHGDVMPPDLVRTIVADEKLGSWNVLGMIYGDRAIARAARQRIRREFRPFASSTVFFTRQKIDRARRVLSTLPATWLKGPRAQVDNLSESFKVAEGEPMRVALKLCYWRNRLPFDPSKSPDPAKDGCGLIWYSPLVPMTAGAVRSYVEMVETVCVAHDIEPLITLTSLNEQCFDSTVPILFDRRDPDATRRAQECYVALFNEGKKQGFMPYRVGIEHMNLITQEGNDFWGVVTRIKAALDPDGILAPGRYSR